MTVGSLLGWVVLFAVPIAALAWVGDRHLLRRLRRAVERFGFADIASACGLVAVQGQVVANKSIRSKLGRVRCVAYRCQIWWRAEYADDPELLVDVSRAVPFRLRDDSGWALVRPKAPRLMAAWKSPTPVPAKLVPHVSRLLRKADAGVRMQLPTEARSVLRADFDNCEGRLLFQEYCIVDGDQAVVLGKGRGVQSARLAELGIPQDYRSAPQVTRIAPAPGDDGVWIAGGTHAELMAELQRGNYCVRDFAGM